MSGYCEQQLAAEAAAVIGGDEPVLAAGVFGLTGLLSAATGGLVDRSILGGLAGAPGTQVGGALLGGITAKFACAEFRGAAL